MAIPERPDGRVENYLANLIGQETAWEPGNPESRVEEYLDYILENGTKTEQEMEDDIAALKSIGRYLSLWNAATGLPVTNPKKTPYTYKAGDYYIVSNVDTTTNYMPSGIKYEGTASVTTDSGVKVNDYYVFDGTTWSRLSHSESSGGGSTITPLVVHLINDSYTGNECFDKTWLEIYTATSSGIPTTIVDERIISGKKCYLPIIINEEDFSVYIMVGPNFLARYATTHSEGYPEYM